RRGPECVSGAVGAPFCCCGARERCAVYTLSLRDALPISSAAAAPAAGARAARRRSLPPASPGPPRRRPAPAPQAPGASPCDVPRSEEHTSELQSRENLVCRLLLEKKNAQWDTERGYEAAG